MRTTGILLLSLSLSLAAQTRVDVLTQHNDYDRTGHNPRETALTPDSVKKGFGKLFDAEVDAQVYAQPLIVSGLTIAGKTRDVLIVATMNNTLYYFDANDGTPLWSKNFGPAARTPNPWWPMLARWGYRDVSPLVGIVSTPVIDRRTNTIYFTSYTEGPPIVSDNPPNFQQWVHALDLVTHADKMGSPVEVTYEIDLGTAASPMADAKLPHAAMKTGGPHVHARDGASPILAFDPLLQMQRPGLLIVKGRLLLAFASHGDFGDYHGWVFNYDASNLQSAPGVWVSTLDLTPDRDTVRGGIWQSGMGLTTDADGNVYLLTGNGDYDPDDENWGDSAIKLSVDGSTIQRASTFTPCDQQQLDNADIDLGSSGILHPPGSKYVIGGGKEGVLYVLNTADLGGQNTSGGTGVGCINPQIPQQVQVSCPSTEVTPPSQCSAGQGDTGHIHGSPVLWKSKVHGDTIYVWCEDDHLRALTWDGAKLAPTSCSTSSWPSWAISKAISPAGLQHGMTGGMLSISSNNGGGGILWATTPTNNNANQQIVPGILYAYDADNLQNELWNSYRVRERDDFGNYAKFTPPTVANGKVYVPTFSNHVSVYGLNPPPPPVPGTNLLVNGDFENGSTGWTFSSSYGSVSPCYTYFGKGAAMLMLTPSSGAQTVSQTITAPSDGDYRLTAYAMTTYVEQYLPPGTAGGTLGVDVNGVTVAKQAVSSYTGYLPQEIEFSATGGQQIKVWYTGPSMTWRYPSAFQANTWANLDEVRLVKK